MLVLVSEQPLLTHRAELESILRAQATRRQGDDGDCQQKDGGDADGDRANHGVIKIRPSAARRKCAA